MILRSDVCGRQLRTALSPFRLAPLGPQGDYFQVAKVGVLGQPCNTRHTSPHCTIASVNLAYPSTLHAPNDDAKLITAVDSSIDHYSSFSEGVYFTEILRFQSPPLHPTLPGTQPQQSWPTSR
jgi:hypothetical protein